MDAGLGCCPALLRDMRGWECRLDRQRRRGHGKPQRFAQRQGGKRRPAGSGARCPRGQDQGVGRAPPFALRGLIRPFPRISLHPEEALPQCDLSRLRTAPVRVALRICGEANVGAGSLTRAPHRQRMNSPSSKNSSSSTASSEACRLSSSTDFPRPAGTTPRPPPSRGCGSNRRTATWARFCRVQSPRHTEETDSTSLRSTSPCSAPPAGGARRSDPTASCPASPLAAANFTVAQATLESGASQVRGAMRGSCSQLK